jgi:hypothetical protein
MSEDRAAPDDVTQSVEAIEITICGHAPDSAGIHPHTRIVSVSPECEWHINRLQNGEPPTEETRAVLEHDLGLWATLGFFAWHLDPHGHHDNGHGQIEYDDEVLKP